MDIDSWIQIVTFLALIVVSAFFSGSESAYFSLTELDLERLRENARPTRSQKRILELMRWPRRLLLGILIGNTVVNVAAATVAAFFIHRFWPHGTITFVLEVVLVTLILLIFSEVSPKILAVKHPHKFAESIALPLQLALWLLKPLVLLFDGLTLQFAQLLRVESELPFSDAEELKALLEVGEENGALDQNEREMIHSIFEFKETVVREVMVPRTDIIQVAKDTSIDDVLDLVKEKGHSRIPVFDESPDQIIGVLHVKDLLPFMSGGKTVPSLTSLVRKAYYVPESKMIDELLREFQQERIHMAIIVDEYGGTAGLVTLEDVIEEIVGEIRDEYDEEPQLINRIAERVWRVDGKIAISELNETLHLELPEEEEYDSLGGLILSVLGHIPQAGESVAYADLLLHVEAVASQRIQTVTVTLQDTTSADTQDS